MSDFIEIDFLDVETEKSGDAIIIHYSVNGTEGINVVDGGYIETGDKIISHIKNHYRTTKVDNVVLTHTDRDHANGLRKVLEECDVRTLWMNRPWIHAEEIINQFKTYNSVDALKRKLKSAYEAAAILEEIAIRKNIPIKSPLQGTVIGPFHVLTPSKKRYQDLIVTSDKTPTSYESLMEGLTSLAKSASRLIKAGWGIEYFPESGTSNENEMSVVQYTKICNHKIVLTGDTGRNGLREAANYSESVGLFLPGVDLFQVPHHGGRHNVSSDILDQWLGKKLNSKPDRPHWSAVCSAAKADEHHPKKSVIRAMLHRGGLFSSTENGYIYYGAGTWREGITSCEQVSYPNEHEC